MPNTLIFTPSLSLYGPFAALCSGFGRALPASLVRRGMRVKVALECAPDQGKLLGGAASSRLELPIGEVVFELLDNEVGHGFSHPLGE